MDAQTTLSHVPALIGRCCLVVVLMNGAACSSTPAIADSRGPVDVQTTQSIQTGEHIAEQSTAEVSLIPQPPLDPVSDEPGLEHSRSEPNADEFIARGRELEKQLEALKVKSNAQLEEILSLYRRIHIELDAQGRSALIVLLFHDPRPELELLGFELADRDLSSSTVLTPEVGEQAKTMLAHTNPQIRSKAARLITRLVPPDAMMVLTSSLQIETDPIAAEPMLSGIARWPSMEGTGPVLKWFVRHDSAFGAACDAAWALEQAGLWDSATQHPEMLARLRKVQPAQLSESGMKLLSRFGDSSDLRVLVSLMLMENPNQQQWAASALVETPRAVEVLAQVAEENTLLYKAACDSLTRHRATPEGLRRLVALPSPDETVRAQAIVRMGEAIPNDRLADAVRLAGLSPELSVLLLNRLLSGNVEITTQVAKGIIRLAEIEHEQLRPNRALEASITLDLVSLDPVDRAKINSIKACSMIFIGKLPDALLISKDASLWMTTLARVSDPDLSKRVAQFMIENLALSSAQLDQLEAVAETPRIDDPDQGDG